MNEFVFAEAALLEAQGILSKTPGPRSKTPRDCIEALVDLYAAWNKVEPGKGYDAKTTEWKKRDTMTPTEKQP